jgi:hypothetical protein
VTRAIAVAVAIAVNNNILIITILMVIIMMIYLLSFFDQFSDAVPYCKCSDLGKMRRDMVVTHFKVLFCSSLWGWEIIIIIITIIPWSESASELYRPSDRSLSAK